MKKRRVVLRKRPQINDNFPLDVMMALWGIREDLQAVGDTLTQLAGLPSPSLESKV